MVQGRGQNCGPGAAHAGGAWREVSRQGLRGAGGLGCGGGSRAAGGCGGQRRSAGSRASPGPVRPAGERARQRGVARFSGSNCLQSFSEGQTVTDLSGGRSQDRHVCAQTWLREVACQPEVSRGQQSPADRRRPPWAGPPLPHPQVFQTCPGGARGWGEQSPKAVRVD